MSLYRKYRPKTLDDLVGQDHITDILRAQAKAQTFSQNYLLCGTRGAGKTSSARLIAKLVNSSVLDWSWFPDLINDPVSARIDSWSCIDIIEIDAASHTWIDNVRDEIIDKAPYPPHELKKKVYIIDEVHMLSKSAFNALLKIMEEPPSYMVFVLATTELQKVPDTIVSRSQVFLYKRIALETIVARLSFIADKEWIGYTSWWMHLLAKAAWWWMRDAIKYLEQLHIVWTVDEQSVSRYLWVVTEETLQLRYHGIRTKEFSVLIDSLTSLLQQNVDFHQFTKSLAFYADQVFTQDPHTSSIVIGMCTTLLERARTFPYFHILYKQYLSELCHPVAAQECIQTQTPDLATKPNSPETDKTVSQRDKTVSQIETAPVLTDDTSGILNTVADQIEQKLLRMWLSKSAHIHAIYESEVHIIVAQQQLYWLVTKPDINQDIEKKMCIVLWKKVTIRWEYMSREDFLLQ